MGKIQLIIDVDENLVCKGFERPFTEEERNTLIRAIGNGKPLPKEHGRLIDINSIESIMLEDSGNRLVHTKGDAVGWFIEAPTILDAEE